MYADGLRNSIFSTTIMGSESDVDPSATKIHNIKLHTMAAHPIK
jgi:hypothetical protein